MNDKKLRVERDGHVTVVYLNRPDKSNSLTLDMMTEIERLANSFNEDERTRVVVFTGVGKNFCTGLDLSDSKKMEQYLSDSTLMRYRHMKIGPGMIRSVYNMDQITIAAINGKALGGGACLASACDFRVGAENCLIGYPEVSLSMNLSWLSLPLCVRLIGPSRAKRMVILAKQHDANTLARWGFLDEIVPETRLMAEALKLAGEYAAQPPLAAQMVKRSVNAITSALDQAIMHMDSDQFLLSVSGDDFEEGIKSLLGK